MSQQKRLSVKDWNSLRRQVEDHERDILVLEGFINVLRQQVVDLGEHLLIHVGARKD